jgi:O-antigen ligase
VARWDALSLIYVRPAAVITIGLLVISPGTWDWRGLRWPLVLLCTFAAIIAIQLVPLPPGLWSSLPGRSPYLDAATIAGIPQPWRPISLLPYRTANSLLAVLPAFAALLALAGIPRQQWRVLADAILIICCVSGLLGALQFVTGSLYPYTPSDKGMPIGLLANRNHQALLLTVGMILMAGWGTRNGWSRRDAHIRLGGALAAILILVTLVLLTGSRTGLALMLIAVTAIFVTAAGRILRAKQRSTAWLLLALSPFVMIAIGAYTAQESSVMRLSRSAGAFGDDMRLLALPTVWEIALHYLPWGTGFGSFDRIFMQFEPDRLLVRGYFNRAHSDPLEIVITGGLPAVATMCAFLVWYSRMAYHAFTYTHEDRSYSRRSAAICLFLALLASLVDYPLRTPLLSVIAILLCGLVSSPEETGNL